MPTPKRTTPTKRTETTKVPRTTPRRRTTRRPPIKDARPSGIRDRVLLGVLLAITVFAFINARAIGRWVQFQLGFIGTAEPATVDSTDIGKTDDAYAVDALTYGPPNTLWIPSLDVHAPVMYVHETTEDAYQEALRYGVGHFPGTAEPGQPGNAYIFGHSSDFAWAKGDYKTVFVLLPQMHEGDLIVASDRLGRTWDFRVVETRVVEPDDLSVLDQFEGGRRMLTLQTSYPIGTALQRFLVIAELAGPAADIYHEESAEMTTSE